jgi:hypothetical protein
MRLVIATTALNFIPAVPSNLFTYNHQNYLPSPTHVIPPNLKFRLRGNTRAMQPTWHPYHADLNKTTLIYEYASTFCSALRLEQKEMIWMYENYSLFQWPLQWFIGKNKAVIYIAGAAVAHPSLQISDVVLLRPVKPLDKLEQGGRNSSFRMVKYTHEIESCILSRVRGSVPEPDQVIISWDLNPQQIAALNDNTFKRTYAIRFIPSSAFVETSLTVLDWMESLSEFQQEVLKTVLFPVTGPIVKPLSPNQKKLPAEVTNSSHPKSDIEKLLNELHSSFMRMVRARTLDPCFKMTCVQWFWQAPQVQTRLRPSFMPLQMYWGYCSMGSNINRTQIEC